MNKEINNNIDDLQIRTMRRGDLNRVIVLEHDVFPDPWPRSAFEDLLKEQGWGGLVAISNNVIIGYACFLIVNVEAHLTNIAVDPDFRRKLVAKRLLETILGAVAEKKCEYILLEVRPSNNPAISFYDKHGFKVLYRRPNYYHNPSEDALVMVKYF